MFRTVMRRNKFAEMAQKLMSQMPKPGAGGAGGEGGSGGGGSKVVLGLGGLALAGLGTISYFARNIMFDVDAGHRALKFNRLSGVGEQVFGEGTTFMIPWFERPIIFDIRTRPQVVATQTGTRDLQMANVQLRTLHRPEPSRLASIYRRVGQNYDEVILKAVANEVLKAVVARYSAQEMITQRDTASREISIHLKKRAMEFGIVIDDVAITELVFSPKFMASVEAKQVAQQHADRAKYYVIKAEEEKKAAIIKAEAQSREVELISAAIQNNPGYIDLLRIDKAKEVATCLARSNNKIVLTGESLLLNVMGKSAEMDLNKSRA